MATMEKRCKVCGCDVSIKKRTKDASGNYYCDPCLQAVRSQTAMNMPMMVTAAPTKTCTNCGGTVGALQEMWDWKGYPVCWTCRETLKDEELRRIEEKQIPPMSPPATQLGQSGETEVKSSPQNSNNSQTSTLWTIKDFKEIILGVIVVTILIPIYVIYMILCFKVVDYFAISSQIATVVSMVLVMLPVLIAVMIYDAHKKKKRCPACGSFNSLVERIDSIGQEARTVRTTTTANVREGYNTYGPIVANIQVPTEKTVLVDRFAVQRRCTKCGHCWSRKE